MAEQTGKTKYDLAIKIIDDLDLKTNCMKAAGYQEDHEYGFLVPGNLQVLDKALELYIERVRKILGSI